MKCIHKKRILCTQGQTNARHKDGLHTCHVYVTRSGIHVYKARLGRHTKRIAPAHNLTIEIFHRRRWKKRLIMKSQNKTQNQTHTDTYYAKPNTTSYTCIPASSDTIPLQQSPRASHRVVWQPPRCPVQHRDFAWPPCTRPCRFDRHYCLVATRVPHHGLHLETGSGANSTH